jgi:signal transduction histidine kinase
MAPKPIRWPEVVGDLFRAFPAYLFPEPEGRDRAFREHIQQMNRSALWVIGSVQIGFTVLFMLAHVIVIPDTAMLAFRLQEAAWIVAIGVVTLACARLDRLHDWWRAIGMASGLATAAVLIFSSQVIAARGPEPDNFIPGQITLVMLLGVTVIPLRPMQTLGMGLLIAGIYAGATMAAGGGGKPEIRIDEHHLLFAGTITLLCTAITAVAYRQRRANFVLQQEQVRMLLAENATSFAKLAAALSHELNNPLGALLSGVDTLLLLASRQATCGPEDQARLVLVQADVRKSIQQSAQRLKALVDRIERFTNLDTAEVQNISVNELLNDVAAIVEPQLPEGAQLKLDLQPVPPVRGRPQQISAVFSNLVLNAIRAVNGSGGEIRILSRQVEGDVEVEIRDNGRGIDEDHLKQIFEPAFRPSGTRVRAANWGMFSSRQIIREHGGEIQLSSGKDRGTTVRVRLPALEIPDT